MFGGDKKHEQQENVENHAEMRLICDSHEAEIVERCFGVIDQHVMRRWRVGGAGAFSVVEPQELIGGEQHFSAERASDVAAFDVLMRQPLEKACGMQSV